MRRSLLAAVAIGSVTLAGCSGSDGEQSGDAQPVEQPPVELVVDEPIAEPVRIGVIATLSAVPGQGADVLPAAEGAQVAAYRLELGGQPVELEVVDDSGTPEGARAAVETLVNARVAGIVAATTGDHVLQSLADAAAADTAVLLPYLRTAEGLPETSWLTGPSAETVGRVLADAMAADELESPFVVTADGVTAPGIRPAQTARFDGRNADAVVTRVRRAVRADGVDSAVVAGSATSQARVVGRLQGAVPDLPLVLTPQALSPVFADQLHDADGTTSARFISAGIDANDTTTLRTGERADSVASYFAALRLLSESPDAQDLFDSVPFAEVAGGADTRSHDAVVALVRAAVEAGSGSAADVLATLQGLQLDPEDGLAGPPLDFAANPALAADEVVALNATSQDPGVRPGLDASHLFWFAVPTASG